MKHTLLFLSFSGILLAAAPEAFAQPGPGGGVAPIITEIMYNPPESGNDTLEFLEVYNPSPVASINMTGYYFSAGLTFQFPDNFLLAPQSYVVVAGDSVIFETYYGSEAFEWSGSTTSLSNTGEALVLRNAGGTIADSVNYGTGGAWPAMANGQGYSLVLCDPTTDNSLAANWGLTTTSTGLTVNGIEIFANPGAASNCITVGIADDNVITTRVFPNPTEGAFSLQFDALERATVLTVHNSLGQLIHTETLPAGSVSRNMDLGLSSGLYVITMDRGTHVDHLRLTVE